MFIRLGIAFVLHPERVGVCLCVCVLKHVQLCDWTVDSVTPLSMGFPRQESWSRLPFSPPGDLPYPGVEPVSPALQGDALPSEPPGKSLEEKTMTNLFCAVLSHSVQSKFL